MAISMSSEKGSLWSIHHHRLLWSFCRDLSARWWVLLKNCMSTHFMLACLHVEEVLWLGTLILLLQVSRWASMRWLQLGSHLIMTTKTTLADKLVVGVFQWILHIQIRLGVVKRGTCTVPDCIADDVCRALFTLVARHGKLTCSSLPFVTTSYQSIFLTFLTLWIEMWPNLCSRVSSVLSETNARIFSGRRLPFVTSHILQESRSWRHLSRHTLCVLVGATFVYETTLKSGLWHRSCLSSV